MIWNPIYLGFLKCFTSKWHGEVQWDKSALVARHSDPDLTNERSCDKSCDNHCFFFYLLLLMTAQRYIMWFPDGESDSTSDSFMEKEIHHKKSDGGHPNSTKKKAVRWVIDFDLNLFILRVILREPKKITKWCRNRSDGWRVCGFTDTYTDNNVGPSSVQQ